MSRISRRYNLASLAEDPRSPLANPKLQSISTVDVFSRMDDSMLSHIALNHPFLFLATTFRFPMREEFSGSCPQRFGWSQNLSYFLLSKRERSKKGVGEVAQTQPFKMEVRNGFHHLIESVPIPKFIRSSFEIKAGQHIHVKTHCSFRIKISRLAT